MLDFSFEYIYENKELKGRETTRLGVPKYSLVEFSSKNATKLQTFFGLRTIFHEKKMELGLCTLNKP